MLLWPIVALVGGVVLLVLSANMFVEGAAATAKRLGMRPLLIGMIIIGFGSSVPEMVISVISSLQGNPGLALGNAIGSNITNIALILGLTAIISPIPVDSSVLSRELRYLAIVTIFILGLFYIDGKLDRMEGISLIALFVAIVAWSIYAGVKTEHDHFADIVEQEWREPISMKKAVIYTTGGLILLVISSRILVWGGVEIAQSLGISDLIIGLTVVAIGTSLPELAASIAAVRKNEHDLALGNVIGSNMFNSTIVLGITGTIAPTNLEAGILQVDIPVMTILTVVLVIMAYSLKGKPGSAIITRTEGIALVATYLFYNASLAFRAMS